MDRKAIEARIAKARQEIQQIIDSGNKAIGYREGQIALWTEMLAELQAQERTEQAAPNGEAATA